jgi:hypothetical protein
MRRGARDLWSKRILFKAPPPCWCQWAWMHDDRASRVRIAYHGPKSVFIPTPSEKAEEEKLAIAANARCNPRESFVHWIRRSWHAVVLPMLRSQVHCRSLGCTEALPRKRITVACSAIGVACAQAEIGQRDADRSSERWHHSLQT